MKALRPVPSVTPEPATPRTVAAEFRALLAGGARLRPAGEAKPDPSILLGPTFRPRYEARLFGARIFLADYRYDDQLNFMVAYVALPAAKSGRIERIYPRLFYKDSSLMWRVATHWVRAPDEIWIGKGDLRWETVGDHEVLSTAEETTNLPLELQHALDTLSRAGRKPWRDPRAAALVLRLGPPGRVAPYSDFSAPRQRARAIRGGRPIARFRRPGDPESLVFVRGYEPDFGAGLIDEVRSGSSLYGGEVRKIRFLSANRRVQYQFVAAPEHVWVNPPQALTADLTTYAVRTVDVWAPEELCVPGYEYHYLDETVDPPELHSQIPAGFVGAPSASDDRRADASAWIEALPVIREFRAQVLGHGARGRGGLPGRARKQPLVGPGRASRE